MTDIRLKYMTICNLSVVFLRFSALNTLVLGVVQMGQTFIATRAAGSDLGFLVLGLGLVIIAIALAIWFSAPWLASKICSGFDAPVQIEGVTLSHLCSLIILGIGLYYFMENLAPALNWIHYFTVSRAGNLSGDNTDPDYYNAFRSIVPFVLSIFAIIFCGRWSELIATRTIQKSNQTIQPTR
jgi:hypothetical protein